MMGVWISMWRVCALALVAALVLAGCAGVEAPGERVAPTTKPPLAGLRVCVDPGHGGYDGGARARDSLVWESAVNLSVAKKLATALAAAGASCVMTREDDSDLADAGSGRKRRDLLARLEVAKAAGAQVYLSVHMNEYRSRAESGPQVFFRAGTEGEALAHALQAALIAGLSPPKERVAQAGDYLVLSLDIPSALVECGFLSNAREEKLLLDAQYQQKIADAIVAGLTAWREAPQPE